MAEIREVLAERSLRRQLGEAWDFQRACGHRLAGPLAALGAMAAALLAVGAALGGGMMWLGSLLHGPVVWIDVAAWPLLVNLGGLTLLFFTSFTVSTVLLSTHRLVNRMRRRGHLKAKEVWREAGLALETAGPLSSLGWGIGNVLALAVVVLAGFAIADWLRREAQVAALVSAGMATGACLLLYWLLVILPQIYTLAIMLRRDCGWFNAVNASLTIVDLDGATGIARAFLATVLCLTIVGIPAGVFLLVSTLDYQNLLLAAILGEKTGKEIESELTDLKARSTSTLEKHFAAMDAGRYLDALNGFQMHLMKDREDPMAMRGEALAYLRLGNPRAREALERWLRASPENPEANRLLKEWYEGEWSESGGKYLEAQARCTQHIGEGVRGMIA